MRKPRSDFEVYNDLDGDVVNVFRVLRDRDQATELERLLRLTPWARREFEGSYAPAANPIEMARRTIVRCFMGHGTTSRRRNRTGFRAGSHPHRRGGGFGDWRGYHDAVADFTDRLQGVVIEERNAFELLERHDETDVVFYVDPPYLASQRTSVRGPGDNDRCYRHELSDDDGHRRLAALLCRSVATVIVSGYPCPLYDEELYVGWRRETHSARGDRASERTEAVWIKPSGITMPAPFSFVQPRLEGIA